jgi:hypothetical protein
MTRPTAAQQKTKTAQKMQCGDCNEIFTGKTCPNCGESVNVFAVNADGIPKSMVADAIGGTNLPIQLMKTPEFDPEFEMETIVQQQFKDVIRDANLDKVKALAAEQATKRLRAEEELKAAEKGFMPPKEDEAQAGTQQQGGMGGMSSAMFMQALGGWNPEARELLFDRLKEDPEFAFNFSRVLKPQPGMQQMPQMNPMGYMNAMMQPPVERAPPTDATEMVTAMITGMQALQEMGGGNKDNSQLDRILDKMDDMRKETEGLRIQFIEKQGEKQGITQDEVRIIIADALSKNSAQQANIQEGVAVLGGLQSLKRGMLDLGLVQEAGHGDDGPSLEQQKLDHDIKMEEKRESRDHELRLKEEEASIEAAKTKGMFIDGLLSAGATQQETETGQPEEPNEPEVVKANTVRPAAVIS